MAGIRPWKRGTAAQRSANLTVPEAGEIGVETDTGNIVVSDGTGTWAGLKRLVRADEVTTGVQAYVTALFNQSTVQLMPTETGLAHARTDSTGRVADGIKTDGTWFAGKADLSQAAVTLPAGVVDFGQLTAPVRSGIAGTMTAETGRIAAFTDSAGIPYLTARLADRALEGVFDLSQSNIPVAGLIYPSGDTTGLTDTTAINAALLARDTTLAPGAWYVQSPCIRMPSNRTLFLQGTGSIFLTAQANSPIITNLHMDATGDTDISVIAQGRWVLDGNAVNQTRQAQLWHNVGVLWVNVKNLRISGVTLKNTQAFGALNEMVTNAWWLNCSVEQDASLGVLNMDGIDWGPGCSYSGVVGLTGSTEDDVFSIFCKNTTVGGAIHPTVSAAVTAGTVTETHHLYFADVRINTLANIMRIQAGDGCTTHHIFGVGLENVFTAPGGQSVIQFGEISPSYLTTYPATDGSSIYEINIVGVQGKFESLINADSYFRDVSISGAQLDSISNAIIGSNGGAGGKGYRISVDFTCGASTGFPITKLPTGWTVDDLTVRGKALKLTAIGANTGTGAVTNIDYDLRVGSITGTAWQSAVPETGRARVYATTAPTWGTGPTAPSSTQLYP